ncbi:hypothetical protein LINPERPRIM_LOCUS44090 [Linum perenne]
MDLPFRKGQHIYFGTIRSILQATTLHAKGYRFRPSPEGSCPRHIKGRCITYNLQRTRLLIHRSNWTDQYECHNYLLLVSTLK